MVMVGSEEAAVELGDAHGVASWWCFALILRGPSMRLHMGQGNVAVKGTLWQWMTFRARGPNQRLAAASFWACMMALVFPGNALVFAAATGITTVHQVMMLRVIALQLSMSDSMMFMCNLSLATTAIIAAVTTPADRALQVAIRSASPAVCEIYAVSMVFAAMGKLNSDFFDPMVSAATGHVMASIENVAANLPLAVQTLCRRCVDAAGPKLVYIFFFICCVAGFVVESVVPLLMYANMPRSQMAMMAAMHSLFSLTVPPFSVAISGFVPFFAAGMQTGIVTRWFGWLVGPWRAVVIVLLAAAIVHPGHGPNGTLIRWRWIHQGCWFACVPLMLNIALLPERGFDFPPGSVTLGMGTQARADAYYDLFASLGVVGGSIVICVSYVGFFLCVHNGAGPYTGLKTQGSLTILYSNIIVETAAGANSFVSPILRCVGLPLPLMTNTITVLESNHPMIAEQLVCDRIAPPRLFAGIISSSSEKWRRAGKITIPTGKFPKLYTAAPGFEGQRDRKDEASHILPFIIPYWEVRCMTSAIVATDPNRDFRVVYRTRDGTQEKFFERKDGVTQPGSDMELQKPPSPILARLCAFRAIPTDLELYNP